MDVLVQVCAVLVGGDNFVRALAGRFQLPNPGLRATAAQREAHLRGRAALDDSFFFRVDRTPGMVLPAGAADCTRRANAPPSPGDAGGVEVDAAPVGEEGLGSVVVGEGGGGESLLDSLELFDVIK